MLLILTVLTCFSLSAAELWQQVHPQMTLHTSKKVAVNTLFEAEFKMKGDCEGFALDFFDIDMPEHAHGMITKAKWQCEAKFQSCQIDGLKLHMPGEWRIRAHVKCGAKKIKGEHKFKVSL